MSQPYKPVPLPFANYPMTADNTVTNGSGSQVTQNTLIDLPNGKKVLRTLSFDKDTPNNISVDYVFEGHRMQVETTGEFQSFRLYNRQEAYIYKNNGTTVDYVFDPHSSKHLTEKAITRAEFINTISGRLGVDAQAWTTQLQQTMPKAGLQPNEAAITAAAAPLAGSLKNAGMVHITTDGKCATIRISPDAKPSAAYCGEAADTLSVLDGRKATAPRAAYSGDVIAALAKEPSLRKSLPAEVLQDIAISATTGTMVMVNHVGGPAGQPPHRAAADKPAPGAKR